MSALGEFASALAAIFFASLMIPLCLFGLLSLFVADVLGEAFMFCLDKARL
jgi:hypothetical protein